MISTLAKNPSLTSRHFAGEYGTDGFQDTSLHHQLLSQQHQMDEIFPRRELEGEADGEDAKEPGGRLGRLWRDLLMKDSVGNDDGRSDRATDGEGGGTLAR